MLTFDLRHGWYREFVVDDVRAGGGVRSNRKQLEERWLPVMNLLRAYETDDRECGRSSSTGRTVKQSITWWNRNSGWNVGNSGTSRYDGITETAGRFSTSFHLLKPKKKPQRSITTISFFVQILHHLSPISPFKLPGCLSLEIRDNHFHIDQSQLCLKSRKFLNNWSNSIMN